jgi:hypothetical protein
MIDYLTANWAEILLIVTSIHAAASVIVKLTPTPKDDEALAKIMKLFEAIALNKK